MKKTEKQNMKTLPLIILSGLGMLAMENCGWAMLPGGRGAPSWIMGDNSPRGGTSSNSQPGARKPSAPVWVTWGTQEDGRHLCERAAHYENGTGGVKRNMDEALNLYSEAIDRHSSSEAKNRFSHLVLQSCRPLADRGHPAANFALAKLFDHGIGVPQDLKMAERCYLNAARSGHPGAHFSLSLLYEEGGEGIEKNSQKSAEFLQRAADNGHMEAQCNFGVMCLRSQGNRAQQDRLGANYLKRAADRGDAKALYNLAKLHVLNRGVNGRDDSKAVSLCQLAAAKGHAGAQEALRGICHANKHLKPYPQDCQDYGK